MPLLIDNIKSSLEENSSDRIAAINEQIMPLQHELLAIANMKNSGDELGMETRRLRCPIPAAFVSSAFGTNEGIAACRAGLWNVSQIALTATIMSAIIMTYLRAYLSIHTPANKPIMPREVYNQRGSRMLKPQYRRRNSYRSLYSFLEFTIRES
ncbi:MAG: hypothetical protein CVU95_15055 [Firmicutes bacterium HGW-Firmicutes-2]|nr:MAG: hypothetical protein CVU95_15055 [Firmicutes bacterium HGW-Firmicutes-2]